MTRQHREQPTKRTTKAGQVRWVARYTGRDGRRLSAGTFARKGPCSGRAVDGSCCAQHAIDVAYRRPANSDTVDSYAQVWLRHHPRAPRTNATNITRLAAVLDVEVDGRPLRDWPLRDLRRRHAHELVEAMLVDQGRAASGAANILRTLSVFCERAIDDELLDVNPFRGVAVRPSDPRVSKQPREQRVFSWEQMHAFAGCAGSSEPLVRVMSDCGVRLGESLGIEHRDVDLADGVLRIRGNAHDGVFTAGDQPTKHHVREIPVPAALARLLAGVEARDSTPLMFPTPTGLLWRERNFYRQVWEPARALAPEQLRAIRPHDLRHSWVTHLRAAGVDPADLAAMAGHSVETATAVYTHALHRSFDDVREAIG